LHFAILGLFHDPRQKMRIFVECDKLFIIPIVIKAKFINRHCIFHDAGHLECYILALPNGVDLYLNRLHFVGLLR